MRMAGRQSAFGEECAHCGRTTINGLYCDAECAREAAWGWREMEADGDTGTLTPRNEFSLRIQGAAEGGVTANDEDEAAPWAPFQLETLCDFLDAAMPAAFQRPWRERFRGAAVPGDARRPGSKRLALTDGIDPRRLA